MKTIKITTLLFLLSAMISIPGCGKYEDGPMFSLLSRRERIANTWKVDNYKKNGDDLTSFYSGYTETYSKEGNYSYSWGNLAGTGTWQFINNDDEIGLTGISNQLSYTLVILKLEENEFWYYYMDGNDKKEFHMISN